MNIEELPYPGPNVHRLSVDACLRAAAFALRTHSRNDGAEVASPSEPATGLMVVPPEVLPEARVAVVCPWLPSQAPESVQGSVRDAVVAACQELVCSGAVPEAAAAWRETPGGWEPCDDRDSRWSPAGFPEALQGLGVLPLPFEALREATPGLPVPQEPYRTLGVMIGVWDEASLRVGRAFHHPGDVVLLLRPAAATGESLATLHTTVLGLIAGGVVRSACGTAARGVNGALADGGRPVSAAPASEAGPESPGEPGSGGAAPWDAGPDVILVTAAATDVGRLIKQAGILGVEARVIATVDADAAAPATPVPSEASGS